jgi:hypothetical protein
MLRLGEGAPCFNVLHSPRDTRGRTSSCSVEAEIVTAFLGESLAGFKKTVTGSHFAFSNLYVIATLC